MTRSGLIGRIRRLERILRPGELRAVIHGMVGRTGEPWVLPEDYPGLQCGVDDYGDAFISRWWTVTFFEGTRATVEDVYT